MYEVKIRRVRLQLTLDGYWLGVDFLRQRRWFGFHIGPVLGAVRW